MNFTRIMLWTAAFCLTTLPVFAQKAGDWYIVKKNNERVDGVRITYDPAAGYRVFQAESGISTTVRRDDVQSVVTPKPAEIAALDKSLEAGAADAVLAAAPGLMTKYQYLGWSAYLRYLEGMAKLTKKDGDGAMQAFKAGLENPDQFEAQLTRGRIQVLLLQQKNQEVLSLIDKMIADAKSDREAAFAFNTRARAYAAMENRKKDAVREYLKTLLATKADQAPTERDEARRAAVALLKEMGDNAAAADVEKIK